MHKYIYIYIYIYGNKYRYEQKHIQICIEINTNMYKNGRIGMDKYITFYNAIPRALNIFQNEVQTGNRSPYSLKISKMKEKKKIQRDI